MINGHISAQAVKCSRRTADYFDGYKKLMSEYVRYITIEQGERVGVLLLRQQ